MQLRATIAARRIPPEHSASTARLNCETEQICAQARVSYRTTAIRPFSQPRDLTQKVPFQPLIPLSRRDRARQEAGGGKSVSAAHAAKLRAEEKASLGSHEEAPRKKETTLLGAFTRRQSPGAENAGKGRPAHFAKLIYAPILSLAGAIPPAG